MKVMWGISLDAEISNTQQPSQSHAKEALETFSIIAICIVFLYQLVYYYK